MSRLKELHEEKTILVKEIRDLADRQDSWDAEDQKKWVAANERFDANEAEQQEIQRSMEVADRVAKLDEIDKKEQHGRSTTLGELRYQKRTTPTLNDHSLAIQAWLHEGRGRDLTEEQVYACRMVGVNPRNKELQLRTMPMFNAHGYQMFQTKGGPDRRTFDRLLEKRISDTSSGAGTIPEGFQYELEQFMVAYGGVRRVARTIQTTGEGDMRWPTADDTSNAAVIVAESGDVTAGDADPTFSAVTLTSYKFSSTVTVSAELIDDSAFNMISLMAEFLGTRLGRGQAAYFATGTGTAQPQGIVTGSTKGADAAVSALTGDNLIDCLLYTSPSPRDGLLSRMPSSA